MKKTVGLSIIISTLMVLGFQNCGGSSGGGGATATAVQPQAACAELSFTPITLIYDNGEHIIPTPPVSSAKSSQNNVTTADVRMTVDLMAGSISVDNDGTVCTHSIAANDLASLNAALVGMKFCGSAVQGATHNVTLRGANQEELSMDLPTDANLELANNADAAALLQDIADSAQDGIDNGSCGGNSQGGNQGNN